MTHRVEVEIDDAGVIRPVSPTDRLPPGRATLTWTEDSGYDLLLMAEPALSDWLRPEEDEAWAYLQPGK